ncbi:beta-1,3-galactosyltransferase 1-like [Eublepharis macularius]|uniref:Hexosyltransferase n=1 Tax=Eublepharis macularius TaxID=481883 RepID=A0AA97JFR3_EUBMA|nr:beta-1,3-galactosyltransferase 1-like [Eublepharis macularius]XP_054836925.1 beta-1,3-galactosyltransferase 1-like [Eublepharis macularius]
MYPIKNKWKVENMTLRTRHFYTSWRCTKSYIFLVGSFCFLMACILLIPNVSHYFTISTPIHVQEKLHRLLYFTRDTEESEESKESSFFRNNTSNIKKSSQKSQKKEGNAKVSRKASKGIQENYIHLHPYRFLINESDKCTKRTPFLLLLIATKFNERKHRQAIRMTWGNETVVPGVEVIRLFMLGVNEKVSNQAILSESRRYHDIIQQDFVDTYKNLTLKTLMGMKWVATYCSKASFVMKTDSDMFVNTEYLIKKLLWNVRLPKMDYFTGSIMTGYKPHRFITSKWFMPKEMYPEDEYPSFCSGTGYVFSTNVATRILSRSLKVPYLYLEDIYVALCLNKEGINLTPPPREDLFNIHTIPFSPCTYHSLITSHEVSPSTLLFFWKILQDKKHECP